MIPQQRSESMQQNTLLSRIVKICCDSCRPRQCLETQWLIESNGKKITRQPNPILLAAFPDLFMYRDSKGLTSPSAPLILGGDDHSRAFGNASALDLCSTRVSCSTAVVSKTSRHSWRKAPVGATCKSLTLQYSKSPGSIRWAASS